MTPKMLYECLVQAYRDDTPYSIINDMCQDLADMAMQLPSHLDDKFCGRESWGVLLSGYAYREARGYGPHSSEEKATAYYRWVMGG